ncbi:MAG: hypothetical protein R2843_08065 [Thermomicrobiales bacterium]
MDRPRVRIAGLEQWLLGFQQFVIRRYAELEDAFAPTVVDLEHARDRLEGFGLELGKMLFPEELVEELWDHRESIGPIHLRSFEPYVPWELVRLWNPSKRSKTPDDRFLGQYDLVRHFSGDSAPQALGRADWTVVIGDYQNQPGYEPVGEEKPFFTEALPMALPRPPDLVPAHKTKVKALLKAGRSDVIHLACHGEADLADIGSSNLIIGVRPRVGGFDPVKLATNDVRSSLRLFERSPDCLSERLPNGKNRHHDRARVRLAAPSVGRRRRRRRRDALESPLSRGEALRGRVL